MSEIEKAIDSCNNLISKYQKRLDGADFHRGSTMHALELERVKINALEKQIPKKPVWHSYVLHCSCCDIQIMRGSHYCNSCGQAIDWSEGKEEVCSSQN